MSITRRAAIGAMSAASYQRVSGANDRVQVGFVGFGLIGAQHVHDFRNQRDCDLAAMCDVYQPRLEQGVAACGQHAKAYSDFRKLLENRDLQAVVVSVPDHWHAMITMLACAAGKDVYVEKPMTLFVREGRWMTDVARHHQRVVQVGTQQRSGRHYQRARQLIAAGAIGKVISARSASFRNVMPGFGAPPDGPAPSELDYDMWLGPAPKRVYNPHRSLYHFRWFWDYSGGQMTNLGAHEMDIIQWVMRQDAPRAVSSSGGRFALRDNGETPDVQDAVFDYDGFTAAYSYREANAGRRAGAGGLEFCGTLGSLVINRMGFEIIPDAKIPPANAIPTFQGHPTGGPIKTAGQLEYWTQAMKEPGSSDEQFDLHVRNFLDCVKSRGTPIADVEQGHHTATTVHLANISMRLGRKVQWNARTEQIVGDREASTYLERPYRAPWDRELRSLLA